MFSYLLHSPPYDSIIMMWTNIRFVLIGKHVFFNLSVHNLLVMHKKRSLPLINKYNLTLTVVRTSCSNLILKKQVVYEMNSWKNNVTCIRPKVIYIFVSNIDSKGPQPYSVPYSHVTCILFYSCCFFKMCVYMYHGRHMYICVYSCLFLVNPFIYSVSWNSTTVF